MLCTDQMNPKANCTWSKFKTLAMNRNWFKENHSIQSDVSNPSNDKNNRSIFDSRKLSNLSQNHVIIQHQFTLPKDSILRTMSHRLRKIIIIIILKTYWLSLKCVATICMFNDEGRVFTSKFSSPNLARQRKNMPV